MVRENKGAVSGAKAQQGSPQHKRLAKDAIAGKVKNVTHAGLSAGRLITPGELVDLVDFLRSIDNTTQPIFPPQDDL